MRSPSRRLRAVATGILLVSILLIWLRATHVYVPKFNVSSLVLEAFLMLLVYSFSKHLFRIKKVTGNAICAALCL